MHLIMYHAKQFGDRYLLLDSEKSPEFVGFKEWMIGFESAQNIREAFTSADSVIWWEGLARGCLDIVEISGKTVKSGFSGTENEQ